MSNNPHNQPALNQAPAESDTGNYLIGSLIGILLAIAFLILLELVNSQRLTTPDWFSGQSGWVYWVRVLSIFATLRAANAAVSAPRQAKISQVIARACAGLMGGMIFVGIASLATTVLFGQADGTPAQRLVISMVCGGVLGALEGLALATSAKVRGVPLGFKQYLLTCVQIDRVVVRSMLRWVIIGLWSMTAVGLIFVGPSFWGFAVGLAGIGVIAANLVNKYNSTHSTSGGHDVNQH